MIINKLKTYLLVLAAIGATMSTAMAITPPAITNYFQPLTVTFKVYRQASTNTSVGATTASKIVTGPSASFTTADLLSAVESAVGVPSGNKPTLGVLTSETNAGVIATSVSTNEEYGTTNILLSTNNAPLVSTTVNEGSVTNVYTLTYVTDTNGGVTYISTNTTLGTPSTSTNSVTNSFFVGDGGSNTLTVTETTNGPVYAVMTGTNTTYYTNLADATLSPTGTLTTGSNSTTVETNAILTNATLMTSSNVGIDTNAVSVITNGAAFTNLTIGTNTVTVYYTNGTFTNIEGTNTVSTNITGAVVVSVGGAKVTIYTNSAAGTNYDNLVVGTNTTTAASTNGFTNIVAIGSDVLVSNGVISGLGTNSMTDNSLSTAFAGGTNDTGPTTTSTVTTNLVATGTNMSGSITNVATTNVVITTNVVYSTNVVVSTYTTESIVTNSVVVTNTFTSTNYIAAGSPILVIQTASGAGVSATYSYTNVPASVLSISNMPSTNEAFTATITTRTTNETVYSIKQMLLNSPAVSFTAQGLVTTIPVFEKVPSSTTTSGQIVIDRETWADVSGYGSTNAASFPTFVFDGSITLAPPVAELPKTAPSAP